jgi:hypothetical protein
VEKPATTEQVESTTSHNVIEIDKTLFTPAEPCLSTEGVPELPTAEKVFKSVILDIPETKIDEEEPTQEPAETESNTEEVEPTTGDAHDY